MGSKGRSQQQLTPLELQIMNVLWDSGPSNVQSVQEKLSGSPKLAYTTVQTMLNVLHRKGRVRRRLLLLLHRGERFIQRRHRDRFAEGLRHPHESLRGRQTKKVNHSLRLGRNLAHSKSGTALESLEPPRSYKHPAALYSPSNAQVHHLLPSPGRGHHQTARQFQVSLPAVNRHKQHVREEREAQ